jgi:hypothetical protein
MKRILGVLMLMACGRPVEIDRPIEPVEPVEPVQLPAVTPIDVIATASPGLTRTGVTKLTRTVKDQTTLIDLQLDEMTVFCTALGYGATFLKVSIPHLDQLAHFDHRVEGTNLPCAAVGECSEEMNADHILQGRPGIEQVSLRVVLIEHLERDWDLHTCQRQLVEDVSAVIRGVPVHHHVEGELEAVGLEHCAGL